MAIKTAAKIIVVGGLCLGAGALGGLFTSPSIPTWYASLAKPSFTPPSWVFAPAWTTLYILMAIAAILVWARGWRRPGVKPALGVFLGQLVLNVLWSAVFFGWRSPGGAVVVISLLWLGIILTILLFRRVSPVAAALLLPYLLWVTFAAVLNVAVWRLNG